MSCLTIYDGALVIATMLKVAEVNGEKVDEISFLRRDYARLRRAVASRERAAGRRLEAGYGWFKWLGVRVVACKSLPIPIGGTV